MNTPARRLLASIDGRTVGTLQELGGAWSFDYHPDWLADPRAYALSPHLPLRVGAILDGASVRPVQWYFDNLLPEEGQRTVLAEDARIDAADAFALLAWFGAESAGSLTLRAPDAPVEARGGLRPLTDADLDARIRALPRVPLVHGAAKRMSLAGAQHKLAVVVEGDALLEPEGARASSHILKPDHPDPDYPHSVANEWFSMRLAGRLGLPVPAVARRYVPSPVYLVKRFDRHAAAGVQRLHAVDACQLLGLPHLFKYREGSIERLAELVRACRSPAVARTRLYAWLVFNLLIGNADAHLKNLSFLVDHEGIRLAPFYDLLSVASYDTQAFDHTRWPATELAWPMLDRQRFADLDRNALLDAGVALGLARATALRQLESLRERIGHESDTQLAQAKAENDVLVRDRPELGPTLAGELRCLRTIRHTVIRDMQERLA